MNKPLLRPADRRTVLLIGNRQRQSLTILRTLRRHGWEPLVGVKLSDKRNNHAHWSRDAAGSWQHTDWTLDGIGFARELKRLLFEHPEIAAIYPVDGAAVQQVNALRDQLLPYVALVLPNAATVELCLNKDLMHGFCRRIGISFPDYRVVHNSADVEVACREIGLPCIVKPLDKAELIYGVKAAVLQDENAVASLLRNDSLNEQRVMVQKYVVAPRYNVHIAARDGRLIAAVVALIFRTDRTDGTGFATSGVTIEPPRRLREECERLVAALNYTGLGCAQWLLNADSGDGGFLELNPRLAGSFSVAEHAGVPLSYLGLRLGLGREVDFPTDPWHFQRGLRFAWTTGALSGCRFEYKQGLIGFPTAARIVSYALGDAVRADSHPTWSWRDPLPVLLELSRPFMFRTAAKKGRKGRLPKLPGAAAPKSSV